MKKNNDSAISLIALVITIIVLLILAGITISLTVGQDGILKRAQEAGKNYTNAADYEREQLAEFTNQTENIINGLSGNKEELQYKMVDGVPVPKGFTYIEGTKETGFVIKDITTNADGTSTATNGNEFVWIPVKNMNYEYARVKWTDNASNSVSYNSCSEDLPEDEKKSIQKYGGFYIGRYETGIIGYDETVKKDNSKSEEEWTGYTNGTCVIQKNKQVWNYITWKKAKIEAEKLYDNIVKSKLCSSYAWDTTLQFIKTQFETYPTNSTGGCYGTSNPSVTGFEENPPCNLYDMGGNVNEWTTEQNGSKYVYRGGGHYDSNPALKPASSRWGGSITDVYSSLGFRVALYIKE